MLRDNQNCTGEFQEKDHGKFFTYRLTKDQWALSKGFTHEVDVLDGIRYAVVKKTVAKVLLDEDQVESWNIKNHNIYIR